MSEPVQEKWLSQATCADPENFLSRRGGGGVRIPRRGLTENFNMAKNNDLAIPGGGSYPLPPPPSGSAHAAIHTYKSQWFSWVVIFEVILDVMTS